MDITVEQAVHQLETVGSDKSGSFCEFFAGKESGIKLYSSKKVARKTYWLQKYTYNRGLAPACWGRFKTVDKHGDVYYGYFTELAEPLCRVEDCFEEYIEYDNGRIQNKHYVSDTQVDMFWALHSVGLINPDVYSFNQGSYNGEVVCIDFSDCETIKHK